MKHIKPVLLSMMLMFTSGVALGDPTFFNWHGITTETDYKTAEHIIKKRCDEISYDGGNFGTYKILWGSECGLYSDFGNPMTVGFSYKGLLTKKLVSHDVWFGDIPASKIVTQYVKILSLLRNNRAYKEVTEQSIKRPYAYKREALPSCGNTYGEILNKLKTSFCGFDFRMVADFEKAILSSVVCNKKIEGNPYSNDLCSIWIKYAPYKNSF